MIGQGFTTNFVEREIGQSSTMLGRLSMIRSGMTLAGCRGSGIRSFMISQWRRRNGKD